MTTRQYMFKFLVFITVFSQSVYSQSADAGKKSLTIGCLKKVVAAVNKQHVVAEGAVYALRVLFDGQFSSSLLVGHSDETDSTDYLVIVEKKNCEVKSIVSTNEGSDVEDYEVAEKIENLFKQK